MGFVMVSLRPGFSRHTTVGYNEPRLRMVTLQVHATPSLPPELWWTILLESVVDTALLSDSPSSLNESITNHALVCRAWSSIVQEPHFRWKAKSRLYNAGAFFLFLSNFLFLLI